MKVFIINLTFTESILGTVPKDPKVYAAHIATKAALTDEEIKEELESVEKQEEKGWTGFHTGINGPILYDYVIKGFFKDACSMLRRGSDSKSFKLKAYKKVIDGMLFVSPRQIPLHLNGGEMSILERPLRAQTAQGERIALARSDTAPVGTTLQFEVKVLGAVSKAVLIEWLDYGSLPGLGQWRNAGYGTFEYTLEEKQS